MTVCGCTAIDNEINDYTFAANSGNSVIRNSISGGNRPGSKFDTQQSQYNNWDADLGLTLTDDDFLSLDDSMMTAPRNPDGSIPQNDFLKLAPTSAAIDIRLKILKGETPRKYTTNKTCEGHKVVSKTAANRSYERVTLHFFQ